MALRAKVLQKKAEKFEHKKLQVLKVTKERVSALEPLLQDVYASRRPKPTDYEVRRDLVRVFNEIAKEIYGNSKEIPVIVEFGSFVMDLFSNASDLDLSVNFRTTGVAFPREKKIQTLRKFARKLYAIQSKGHIYGVLPITTAKVPILKCVDRGTGVECDISVENRDGILKSQIIHIISSIDERFQKLSFLMKTWAKAHNINSSKDKTLNSLSIILLVAFHLQTRDPPILPPFSAIFKDGTDPATVVKSLSNFVNYGKRNRETLAELFVTLLIKLSSVEKLWPKGLCASTCSGSWTSKTWDSKVASISVEDFTDQSQNVARAVGLAEVKQIYKCIDISIRHIFSFIDGQIGIELRDLMFGQDGMPTRIPRGTPHLHPIAALPCIPSQANQTKGLVSGKRRKQTMRMDSALPYRITPVECRTGTQSGSQEQVQQAILLDSVSTKKMRTAEGWRGMPSGSQEAAHMGGCVATQQPIDPRERQQPMGGWSGVYAGGWEGTQQPAAVGWGLTQQPSARGWEVARQPTAGGWGGARQTTGWVGAQQTTDWGGAQQATSWGGAQQTTGWGGAQQATSWGGAHQTTGLGGAQQTTGWGGAQQATGWGGAHQPGVGWGWTQQHTAGAQRPSEGGCGGTSASLWRREPYNRSF
ncbi:Terminal uridylyltransferase 7 [Sesamum angolense]|uniref:Terminal uridylyltransferase 7 n=1 Tax=Sesamum angolense TaxID=2727404 RepID=A0AAE1WYS0_9LAMI|nr:Terminal uridylyltransferase 7 [Sesamum angolense]